jgi:hypothetical protein
MQMHQVDAKADSEWNYLVASNPKGCIIDVNQQFVVEASRIARKWQGKIGAFQEVRKRALELILDLGPSFEEEEKEKAQEKYEIKRRQRRKESNRHS